MTALHLPPHTLSIVVPFYNEEDNIGPLVKRVHEALVDYTQPWGWSWSTMAAAMRRPSAPCRPRGNTARTCAWSS